MPPAIDRQPGTPALSSVSLPRGLRDPEMGGAGGETVSQSLTQETLEKELKEKPTCPRFCKSLEIQIKSVLQRKGEEIYNTFGIRLSNWAELIPF